MNDSANAAAVAGSSPAAIADDKKATDPPNMSPNGDRAGTVAAEYTAFTAEVAKWMTVRGTAMAEAQAYLVAKRLNARLAAAYKRTYDVYAARYAAYNGTTGNDITGKSAKAAYDAGT
jgi:hypothetical protein